jgi:small-conductance mechanosensitive channel
MLNLDFLNTPLTTRIILIVVGTFVITNILSFVMSRKLKKWADKSTNKYDDLVVSLFQKTFKVVVWIIALIVILQNMGVELSALIGGLGIAGIALAFGLQNMLSELFSFFLIYFDKPFEVGDYIVIGKDSGTVESVGIKSTRIRTLQGQELVVSNKELTSTRINNYRKMKKRRVSFDINIPFDTGVKKLEKVPLTVEKVIAEIESCTFDRCHFKTIGNSFHTYEVVYFLNSGDYKDYMDVQQDINLGVVESLGVEKTDLAIPAQEVTISK